MRSTALFASALFGVCAAAVPLAADDHRVAEDQTPTGKFLTAGEVRPILGATKKQLDRGAGI